jgi:predicted ATP-dependent endonuclease of OLD family
MIIDSIKLHGWRSYPTEGVSLDNLKSINLIIGPNNSGKSNLSKYFNYLKSICDGKANKNLSIKIIAPIEEGQTWCWKKKDIVCNITLSSSNDMRDLGKLSYTPASHKIGLICQHNIKNQLATLNYSVDDKVIFNEDDQIRKDLNSDLFIDPRDNIKGFRDNKIYWNKFLDSLVFVDPIRHHSRNSENTNNFYFDGAEIITELDSLRGDDTNKSSWTEYKNKIRSWLSDILCEDVTSIEVSKTDLRLEFNSTLAFSLDELGTGVSQIIMLLSHLWLNKDKNLNVFLEEPEANLHPDSVIKLVKIFEQELTNHKFFITTHSPSLIDCLNDKWSVFRTLKNNAGSSELIPNDNVIKHYETLDALGVRASQILQANTVIWVEGPSDRIYINKWIELFSDNKLQEGKDFSFLFFGGTNLASFSALEDEDETFINMLSTSRKAYLITDSDCSSQADKDSRNYKSTLQAMMKRIDIAQSANKGVDTKLEDYLKVWITDGREIENYLCKDLLFDVLKAQGFRRESIGKDGKKKQLKLSSTESSDFIFEKFDSFDKAISKTYEYSDKLPLEPKELGNIALSYSNKKVPIAKEVVKNWELKHAEQYDLTSRLEELVEFIKR